MIHWEQAMLRTRTALCAIAILLNITHALAQNAPPTDCDTLAAHPNDPNRKAPGLLPDKINPNLAVPACEKALGQYPNDARLNFQLGRAYDVTGNNPLALRQYQKAADQDYAPGQSNLGSLYATGRGVGKDDSQAVALFRKAAAKGFAPAQSNLGTMYQHGKGVAKDLQEALKWYRVAAEQKYVFAQLNLGSMYYAGEGVGKDPRQAAVWYRLAAEQGDSQAQTNLGLMYVRGEGVTQDDREGVKWYRLAAAQGTATAQSNLGTMYGMGRGVGQDFVRAYMWLNVAAAKLTGAEAKEATGNLSITEKNLTAAQLAQAKEMARRCEARHFLNCD
jgi:TPR repeat protein